MNNFNFPSDELKTEKNKGIKNDSFVSCILIDLFTIKWLSSEIFLSHEKKEVEGQKLKMMPVDCIVGHVYTDWEGEFLFVHALAQACFMRA